MNKSTLEDKQNKPSYEPDNIGVIRRLSMPDMVEQMRELDRELVRVRRVKERNKKIIT